MSSEITSSARPLRDIYTVSRLNREVRTILEGSFPLIWLEGELSNFSRPASGHWYFSLKDEAAQVRCAMHGQVGDVAPFENHSSTGRLKVAAEQIKKRGLASTIGTNDRVQ